MYMFGMCVTNIVWIWIQSEGANAKWLWLTELERFAGKIQAIKRRNYQFIIDTDRVNGKNIKDSIISCMHAEMKSLLDVKCICFSFALVPLFVYRKVQVLLICVVPWTTQQCVPSSPSPFPILPNTMFCLTLFMTWLTIIMDSLFLFRSQIDQKASSSSLSIIHINLQKFTIIIK